MALRLTPTLIPNVTQTRIERGVRGAGTCPIAITLSDRGYGACVGQTGVVVSLKRGDAFRQYRLPAEAQAFIERFDAGLPVEPLKFRMRRV